ncbi:ACT domain-containing protein [Baekduia soli]|uniref:ACT domain-containing protein n=1 Tax=Baekduia soli TaxID=496014 RepID=UPI001652A3BB|nr:ACT domain-containing protein [Baekduia soli]
MRLRVLPGEHAVCRLAEGARTPDPPATAGGFWSLTLAGAERSLVCAEALAPTDGVVVGGWRILELAGPLDLGLVGVLAAVAAPLAHAAVPVFPIATHDTDWILVPGERLAAAVGALRAAGHEVDGAEG